MSDLIKREDAERYIYSLIPIKQDADEIVKAIKVIPSADRPSIDEQAEEVLSKIYDAVNGINALLDRPSGEWIPCSERLPSEQGQYLVTFPLCNGDPWVYVLSFCKGKFYETDDEWGDVEYDDVTAWMPLPEPWKGADNEMR